MQSENQAQTGNSAGYSENRAQKAFNQRSLSDSQIQQVERIKTKAEALWNEIDNIGVPHGDSEAGRLVSLAKTSLEETVLWGVKAVSRQ